MGGVAKVGNIIVYSHISSKMAHFFVAPSANFTSVFRLGIGLFCLANHRAAMCASQKQRDQVIFAVGVKHHTRSPRGSKDPPTDAYGYFTRSGDMARANERYRCFGGFVVCSIKKRRNVMITFRRLYQFQQRNLQHNACS
jgi:hypothetical protein